MYSHAQDPSFSITGVITDETNYFSMPSDWAVFEVQDTDGKIWTVRDMRKDCPFIHKGDHVAVQHVTCTNYSTITKIRP